MTDLPYKVRYRMLPSKDIFNPIGPDNTLSKWTPPRPRIDEYHRIDIKYHKLEASILKEGIRNPILVIAGWYGDGQKWQMPKEWHDDKVKTLICWRNGGSRLWAAQRHNLDVPCLIADYVNMFPDDKELTSIEEIFKIYKDKPNRIKLIETGIKVYNLPQIHLMENYDEKNS